MKKIVAKKPPLESIRNRNVETRRIKASELLPNPANWRTHPAGQSDALRAVLSEVGFVGTMIGVDTPKGVMLLDGHLRTETAGEAEIDVTIVDLTPAEQAKVLATYDPLTDLAETDAKQLDALLREFETGDEDLANMLTALAEENGIDIEGDAEPTAMKPLDTLPPPAMTWVLVGIPTVRFGEIAETAERLASVDGILFESCSNDG